MDFVVPSCQRKKIMKALGATALAIGVILFAIYVSAWVELVLRCGAKEAVRRGLTLWPGNALQFAILVSSIIFCSGGLAIMKREHSTD